MNKNIYTTLEFDKIISILSTYIKTYSGIRELSNIAILPSIEKIRYSLELSNETMKLIKYDTNMYFEPISDIEDSISNSKIKGYIIPIDDLLELKKTLAVFISNSNSITPHLEKYPLLSDMLSEIKIPHSILDQLEKTLDSDGNILDSASTTLKKIRKQKSSFRTQIKRQLNKIIEQNTSDRIITIRDGRYVIPVKTSKKKQIQSIIHSFSKSGETAYVEPTAVVTLNNDIIENDEREAIEIRRILRDITQAISYIADDIFTLIEIMGKLEILYAKAKFAIEYKCGFPIIDDTTMYIDLQNAIHPLLAKKPDIVPINISLGKDYNGLIISGPNAGGKTAALKTTGILTIMALSGLPITADSKSTIGMFSNIMAEIGDEQSLTEDLSTFSGHIVNIANILKQCDKNSLVLIDELAAATEPREGEALGQEIILELLQKQSRFVVTTHFRGIKKIPYSNTMVKNAFVEFDEENLKPLYSLHIGTSGGSYALKVARQYGIDHRIIDKAETYLRENSTDSEKIIKQLEQEREILFKQQDEVKEELSKIQATKAEISELKTAIENEKQRIEKKGISLLKQELSDALKQLSALKIELSKRKKDAKNIKAPIDTETTIDNAQNLLSKLENTYMEKERGRPSDLKKGQIVYVSKFDKEGYIEEVLKKKAKVRIGLISSIVDIKDIFLPYPSDTDNNPPIPKGHRANDFKFIVDIRGERVEDALKILDKNLDSALMSEQQTFEIIHGKGSGALRNAVREYLKEIDFVESYEYAKPKEGGQGKTIVQLK